MGPPYLICTVRKRIRLLRRTQAKNSCSDGKGKGKLKGNYICFAARILQNHQYFLYIDFGAQALARRSLARTCAPALYFLILLAILFHRSLSAFRKIGAATQCGLYLRNLKFTVGNRSPTYHQVGIQLLDYLPSQSIEPFFKW
jgi:hypothetical protein